MSAVLQQVSPPRQARARQQLPRTKISAVTALLSFLCEHELLLSTSTHRGPVLVDAVEVLRLTTNKKKLQATTTHEKDRRAEKKHEAQERTSSSAYPEHVQVELPKPFDYFFLLNKAGPENTDNAEYVFATECTQIGDEGKTYEGWLCFCAKT